LQDLRTQITETTEFLRQKADLQPEVGIILGTGLGTLVDLERIRSEKLEALKQTLFELERNYALSLVEYEDKEPPVVAAENQIAVKSQQILAELESIARLAYPSALEGQRQVLVDYTYTQVSIEAARRRKQEFRDFLDKYALLPVQKDMKTPVVVLRMNDDEAKSCPFLTDKGCGIYSDRPWPCRMYPVGMAAQKDTSDGWRGDRFYFLLQEDVCEGFDEPREWSIREWLESQGIDEYDFWGEGFKELTLHEFFENGGVLSPERMHMLFTACYDIDRFREFVFESTLLQRFEVDEDFVEEMRTDDEALLRFAFLWVRFSLFGEPTVKLKAGVAEAFKGSLDKRKLFGNEPASRAPEREGCGGSS